ncbi:formimidoylglutamate deiminase [Isoptericola halotolerans]|uniref:Formiminoglutamate deiminase n=1 Tax=Isoptericola halotolerans TaxID=300560 RepID=A0ABX2A2D9_9MICO|nr:formimidoylglutamate deiminase [Isoptericola halotolerans]NOV95927.1 formiminoglutamate deiminase [Isoptericola halotolerans]
MTFWCEHAWLPGGLADGVRVDVRDGRFTAVTAGATPSAGDTILDGVVLPGLANAHSHAFHRALRGRTHDDGGSFWTWRERMYAVADVLTPDLVERLAAATYAEMALAGVTSVGEFHYLHHVLDGGRDGDPLAMAQALRRAAARAGVRLTLLDTCYLHGGLDADGYQPRAPAQRCLGDGDLDTWRSRVDALHAAWRGAQDVRVGAAVHSVRAVAPDEIAAVASWVREHDAPLHVHLSEQRAENEAALAALGASPTRILDEAGALGPHTTAVHAVHLDADEIARLATTGTAVCVCPATERDLADGLAPVARFAAAGVPLCVGSDQHVTTDLLAEARGLEEHARLGSGRRGVLAPADLVTAVTAAGHRALGWDDVGLLEVGARADLVAVSTDGASTAGADPAQVVLVAGAHDVRTVVRDGRTLVRDGRHVDVEVAAALRSVVAEVWSRVEQAS